MVHIYRKMVIGILISISIIATSKAQIHSTIAGGPWDSTWTWEGGIVPGITHDVIINGTVFATHAECNNLEIAAAGILENNYYLYDATVYGNVINNGTIRNQTGAASPFAINVHGNISNNGTWNNYKISLLGTNDQLITSTSGNIFQCEDFVGLKNTGTVIFEGVNTFNSADIRFPGSNLAVTIHPNSAIYLINSKWSNGDIIGSGETSVIYGGGTNNTNAAKLYSLSMTDLSFEGELNISNCSTNGSIVNNAILQNDFYGYSLYIYGSILNNGTIRNYPEASGFPVLLFGNATNNGIWMNQSITFGGGDDQVFMCTPGNSISTGQFINNKAEGKITIPNDITFTNTNLIMNGNLMEIADNCILDLQNSTINQGKVYASTEGASFIQNKDANSNDMNSEYGNIILTGEHNLSNTTYKGDVTNNAIVQNDFFGFTATIEGTLINNNTIKSYPGGTGFTLNLKGNIVQNGIIYDIMINLTGNSIQEISCETGKVFSPYSLTSNNTANELNGLTNLRFENTFINLNNDALIMNDGRYLSLSGGQLENAQLMPETESSSPLRLHMENNAKLITSNLYDATLEGRVICAPTNFHGNIVNNGILENDFYTYSINIFGDLYNSGIIRNQPNNSPLYINISGDLTNNGDWINSRTILNGTTDQAITIRNANSITGLLRFESDIVTSPFEWNFNGTPIDPASTDFSGEDTQSLHWLVPVTNSYLGFFNCITGGGTSRNITIGESYGGGSLALRVFLEGSFNGINMNSNLNSELPLHQPFNDFPWEYNGIESVSEIPPNVVDWILIELRDASGINAATFDARIGRKAAFILNNGIIVDLDGSSPVSFDYNIDQNLFVVIWHRNHIPVLSAFPLIESGGIYTHDFTTSADQAYADNQASLGVGAYGMFSGDLNADGIVDDFDLSTQWDIFTGSYGYLAADGNLDTQVDNKDKNESTYPNFGQLEQFPDDGFVNCGDLLFDDRNGEDYNTVQIGTQCWMAENINIGNMVSGTSNQTDNEIIEKYCYDNIPSNCDTYGGLYQWREVMQYSTDESNQGICPTGWHIPSHSEWCTMEQFLDPTVACDDSGFRGTNVGTLLKEGGLSGFEALIVGQRQFNGTFDLFGFRGHFWTSTDNGSNYAATMRMIQSNDNRVFKWEPDWIYGYSLRCVWDGSE